MRLRPRIFFDEKKQLDDELPNDVLSASNEKLMGKDPSKSSPEASQSRLSFQRQTNLKGFLVTSSQMARSSKKWIWLLQIVNQGNKAAAITVKEKFLKEKGKKSCTSTAKAREKKRHKEEGKTPPIPKKQEVAQLLSRNLRHSTGKGVKSQPVVSQSSSYPSAPVLNSGKFDQNAGSNAIFDRCRAIMSPSNLLDKLGISVASGYGSNHARISPLLPAIKVAQRIEALDGRLLTLFFTKIFCFSNHFFKRDLMEIDGVKFTCVEQFYMYYKAKVFGDERAANRIMLSNAPAAMKKVGSSIANFNEKKWRSISVQVMVIGALRKFEQNADLRQHLFDTAGSILVEASPSDKYWGVGLGMKSPDILDIENWPGQNVLGKTLTMIREKLMRRDEFKAERRVPCNSKMSENLSV